MNRPATAYVNEGVGPTADERMLRALQAEHGGPLLGYAMRLTGGDRQQAEEVVQETLLRAWRHPEALTGRPIRPWLFTVARNIVVDIHRARQSRPSEVGEAFTSQDWVASVEQRGETKVTCIAHDGTRVELRTARPS